MPMASIAGARVQDTVSPAAVGFMLHYGLVRSPAVVQAIRPWLRMRAPQAWQHLPQAAYLRSPGFD